jgi:hypothetical protein
VNPGTLFTDVGHFKKVGIESCRLNGLTVSRFVHSGGASRYHHPINAIVSDIVLNQILTRIRTHILIISGNRDMRKRLSKCLYLLDIYRSRNVDSTMTDINADFHGFSVIRDL